jgi:hypothetical protein
MGANTSKAGNIQPAGNRLYRYDLDLNNNKLTNPVLLLNLPASPLHKDQILKDSIWVAKY